ncbi:MAG TPA: hypothetical protein VGR82_19555 [Methylomirabilota bacterium]|nr:hypothetical protein [Methylomirabilota bacterium]
MTRTLRPGFDRHVLRPAFAVMFRDGAGGGVVSEDLRVELREASRIGRPQRLTANARGVFVAHAVRRMRVPADDVTSPLLTRRFRLTVTDPRGRFVPLGMDADLPTAGLFQPVCLPTSPSDADPHVPLFSAAGRTVPAGHAVVRADLRLASHPDVGAAWARLELWLGGGVLAEGVADRHGAALLHCPLPPLRDPPLRGSPPHAEPARWPVSLRAYWAPGLAAVDVPDLCALVQLPEVTLLEQTAPARPLGPLVLEAGVPLVVRSADSSFLLVGA